MLALLPPLALAGFRLLLLLLCCTGALSAAERQAGQSYFGEKKYVEYLAGDLPIVISAPHGGREKAAEIPTRKTGVVQMDTNTQDLARALAAAFHARTGHWPHVIFCRLHREKLDCNREIVEAAAGHPVAEKAWHEYHGFIEEALAAAEKQSGRVFYIDLHGHGHKEQRLELGYLHAAAHLAKDDAALNDAASVASGSLRALATKAGVPYTELLRGPRSLGALLEAGGFPATPSPAKPVPGTPFFPGGYSVRRHAWGERPVAGLQIECYYKGVRDSKETRARFATALVAALQEYLTAWKWLSLPVPADKP